MKKIALLLIALWTATMLSAQSTSIPVVDLRDLDGNIVSSAKIAQPGESTVIVFWKSSSGKCLENIEKLQEAWDETLKDKGIKLIAICVDGDGAWTRVKPLVNGNGWDFDTYIDVNGDFKRALNVGDVPYTLLFDQDQELVCRLNSVCSGSQEFICQNINEKLGTSITAANIRPNK